MKTFYHLFKHLLTYLFFSLFFLQSAGWPVIENGSFLTFLMLSVLFFCLLALGKLEKLSQKLLPFWFTHTYLLIYMLLHRFLLCGENLETKSVEPKIVFKYLLQLSAERIWVSQKLCACGEHRAETAEDLRARAFIVCRGREETVSYGDRSILSVRLYLRGGSSRTRSSQKVTFCQQSSRSDGLFSTTSK